MLIEAGVPEAEIAFIHDAESDAEKKLLFDAVNAVVGECEVSSREPDDRLSTVHHGHVELHDLDAAAEHGSLLCAHRGDRAADRHGRDREVSHHEPCAAARSHSSAGKFSPPR